MDTGLCEQHYMAAATSGKLECIACKSIKELQQENANLKKYYQNALDSISKLNDKNWKLKQQIKEIKQLVKFSRVNDYVVLADFDPQKLYNILERR